MLFPGSPSQRPAPGRAPAPQTEEPEGCYFIDFGATFAEEVEKLLRIRRQGMMCEIVFWQDVNSGI